MTKDDVLEVMESIIPGCTKPGLSRDMIEQEMPNLLLMANAVEAKVLARLAKEKSDE